MSQTDRRHFPLIAVRSAARGVHPRGKNWLRLFVLLPLLIIGGIVTAFLAPDLRPPLPHSPHKPIQAVTTGSFTQPWCVDTYTTTEQWDAEFQAMREAGLDLWIYQWTGDSAAKTTIYPTRLPGYRQSSAYDQVDAALAAAERHGMKVFMGLVFNNAWWQKEGSDRDWLMAEAAAMQAVADELYQQYYPRYKQVFAGWYINWEMDNVSGYNIYPTHKKNMVDALAAVSGHLKDLNPNLPTSIAPFFNSHLGVGPRRWQYFWYDIMQETDVDIIMLQDGVGVNHASVDQLPAWFEAVCDAAHAAGKQCWSDLENFATPSGSDAGPFEPAPPGRVFAQHQAVAPYVDRIITFSFIAYLSPAWGIDPALYEAYLNYKNSQP